MDSAFTLIILLMVLLILLLAVSLLMYYLTQQDLRSLTSRLSRLDASLAPAPRSGDTIRRERSAALDQMALMEAGLSTEPREALTPEEVDAVEQARSVVKSCNAELRRNGQWMGLPFDLEWAELQDRMPQLRQLYRQAVEAELKAQQGQEAPPQPAARAQPGA